MDSIIGKKPKGFVDFDL